MKNKWSDELKILRDWFRMSRWNWLDILASPSRNLIKIHKVSKVHFEEGYCRPKRNLSLLFKINHNIVTIECACGQDFSITKCAYHKSISVKFCDPKFFDTIDSITGSWFRIGYEALTQ